LFGVLAPEPLWSRRLRVLLAAGVLAVSAGATTTSVASEPDDQQEGVVLPAPGAPAPVGDGLGQGYGGETALPFEVDPVLTGPEHDSTGDQADDAAPLEATPLEDPDAALMLSDPHSPAEGNPPDLDSGEVDPSDTPAPPAPPAEATPPGTSQPPTIPADDGEQHGSAEDAPAAKPERRSRAQRDDAKRHVPKTRARELAHGEPRPADPPATYTPSTDVAALADEAQPTTVTAVAPAPRRIRGRFHVVQSGESLWSIASGLLGPGASPARIALEVRRLWHLNKRRIATGDPNLLSVGVKLRLR